MRLNILPNQFYAALAIFSTPKRWAGGGGGAELPNFRLGGYSPPAPPPLFIRDKTLLCWCTKQGILDYDEGTWEQEKATLSHCFFVFLIFVILSPETLQICGQYPTKKPL